MVKSKHPAILLLLALLFLGMGAVTGVIVKSGLDAAGIKDTLPGRFIQLTLQVCLVLFFYRIYLRKFEKRGLEEEYPRKKYARKIAAGLALGAGLIAVQVGVLAALGNYSMVSFQPSTEVIKYLFLMILIGFLEELVTRAVIFRLMEKWAGSLIALAVVTVEGALTHATNPNSTVWSSIAVGLEFGTLMTLLYMVTRNLWTVSALHFAWNFTMGGIFGINVSGTDAQSLFAADISGPAWLTGGEFGIEAGTPALILTIVLSIYLITRLLKTNGFRVRGS